MVVENPEDLMREKDRDLLEATLKQIKFYDRLSESWKKDIGTRLHVVVYKKHDAVVRKGRSAGAFYVVASGRMGVMCDEPGSPGEDLMLKEFSRGDHFGSYGLLTGGKRTYSIVAEEDAVALIMGKDDFTRMLKENPGMKQVVEEEAQESKRLLEEREKAREDREREERERAEAEAAQKKMEQEMAAEEKGEEGVSRGKSILSKFRSLLKRKK